MEVSENKNTTATSANTQVQPEAKTPCPAEQETAGDGSEEITLRVDYLTLLGARFEAFNVPGLTELQKRLTGIGGNVINPLPEQKFRVRLLLKEGKLYHPKHRLVMPFGTGSSARDALQIWAENPVQLQLITGYALQEDGDLWHQHNWLWQPTTGMLIDSTHGFAHYYGAELANTKAFYWVYRHDRQLLEQDDSPLLNWCAELAEKYYPGMDYAESICLLEETAEDTWDEEQLNEKAAAMHYKMLNGPPPKLFIDGFPII